MGLVEDLAVDWLDRTVYWTDSSTNKIKMTSLNAKHPPITVLYRNLHMPLAIAVDPINR